MKSMLALLADLRALNEQLERGERVAQLIVHVPSDADRAAVARAIRAEAARRGVRLEQVDQVVVVRMMLEARVNAR